MSRWFELSFIEDVKILQKYGPKEYYNKANRGLYEFLDPELAYKYELCDFHNDQKIWKIEKQDDDPIMIVTFKKQNINENKCWILDFQFIENEKEYTKDKKILKGEHYLDTVTKIIRDEVLLYFKQSDLNTLYFETYIDDGAEIIKKNLFQHIADRFISKNQFDIKIENTTFVIDTTFIKGILFVINKIK